MIVLVKAVTIIIMVIAVTLMKTVTKIATRIII